jgi:hypothetical protein
LAVWGQREYDRSALAAATKACEEPGLAAESNAQHLLGSIVTQADAPVFKEARKAVHGFGHANF